MTNGEARFCGYQYNLLSDFYKKLFELLFIADCENLNNLRLAFPEECEAFHKYKNEKGYWGKLDKEFGNLRRESTI